MDPELAEGSSLSSRGPLLASCLQSSLFQHGPRISGMGESWSHFRMMDIALLKGHPWLPIASTIKSVPCKGLSPSPVSCRPTLHTRTYHAREASVPSRTDLSSGMPPASLAPHSKGFALSEARPQCHLHQEVSPDFPNQLPFALYRMRVTVSAANRAGRETQ